MKRRMSVPKHKSRKIFRKTTAPKSNAFSCSTPSMRGTRRA